MLSRFRNSLGSCITYRNYYVDYVQGQSPEPKVREYFYCIDHQGMHYNSLSWHEVDQLLKSLVVPIYNYAITHQEDPTKKAGNSIRLPIPNRKLPCTRKLAEIKLIAEKKFLTFFFKRLRQNDTGRYQDDFPYLSICGRERNFVRCDDLPIVFTHVLQIKSDETSRLEDWLSYAHAGDSLMVPFEPEKLCMSVSSGRVYHPASLKLGGVGLVRAMLAIEFSRFFDFENGEENGPTHFNWNGKRHCLDKQWHEITSLGKK